MRYPNGDRIEVGDKVLLEAGAHGVVVGLIGEAAYAPAYTAADWGYLETGVLIEAEDAGLIHYSEPDEAWVLLARA